MGGSREAEVDNLHSAYLQLVDINDLHRGDGWQADALINTEGRISVWNLGAATL